MVFPTFSFTPFLPVLEDRDDQELLADALDRLEAENAALYLAGVNSPAFLLLGTQIWLMRFYISVLLELPVQTVLALLSVSQAPIPVGTAAVGNVIVETTAPVNLDTASVFPGSNGLDYFPITVPQTLAAGTNDVAVRCGTLGVSGNAPEFTITSVVTNNPLSIENVSQPEPIVGGSNPPSTEASIESGILAIKRRDILLSADDFQAAAEVVLGVEGVARTVSTSPGTVDVYVGAGKGVLANDTLKANVLTQLSAVKPLGSIIQIRDIGFDGVLISVIARILPNFQPNLVAEEIRDALIVDLDYRTFDEPVIRANRLIQTIVTQVGGIDFVESVKPEFFSSADSGFVNDLVLSSELPTVPDLEAVSVSLAFSGQLFTVQYLL